MFNCHRESVGHSERQSFNKRVPLSEKVFVMDLEKNLEVCRGKIKTVSNAIVAFEFYQTGIIPAIWLQLFPAEILLTESH